MRKGVSESELKAHAEAAGGRRVTKDDLEANVKSYVIFRPYISVKDAPVPEEAKLLTICILTCQNGFTVVGESACADPAMFDEELGQRLALNDAKNKLWSLMGYELKSKIAYSR